MKKVRAAVCHGFGQPLTIEDVHLKAPITGEVEVQLAAVAICHSDILYMEGAWGGNLPAVYGHEASGFVTTVGDGVVGVCKGDRVLVTLMRACGHCIPCASGKPTCCETGYDKMTGPLEEVNGGQLEHGLQTGAFAEMVVVDQSQVQVIPDTVPMDAASLMSCGVITGFGAVTNTAGVEVGSTVVVIGAGGVGLNTIQGAAISGASQVIAVDISEEKLDAAMEFGATAGVLATTEKPHRAVKKLTGGRGVDYVFVTVGAIAAYQSATSYLASGGTVVAVGMPASGAEMKIEPVMLAATGQNILGSSMGSTVLKRDVPYLVALYEQGRLKLDELITKRYSLDEINEAIADTKAGNARRNVIVF
jgi:S-(hydroxymethyl)glutathione dehydrogenase/alcohol dehydrogenase